MDVALRIEGLLAGAPVGETRVLKPEDGAIVVPAARPGEAAADLLKLVFENLAGVDGPLHEPVKGHVGPDRLVAHAVRGDFESVVDFVQAIQADATALESLVGPHPAARLGLPAWENGLRVVLDQLRAEVEGGLRFIFTENLGEADVSGGTVVPAHGDVDHGVFLDVGLAPGSRVAWPPMYLRSTSGMATPP